MTREAEGSTAFGLTIGGRRYRRRPALSFRQSLYVNARIRDAGLYDLRADAAGETPDVLQSRLEHLVASESVLQLLAGLVVEEEPDGTLPKWREDEARLTAERFGDVEDPVEQARLLRSVLELLTDFFVNGPTSPTRSGSSSMDRPSLTASADRPAAGNRTAPISPSGASGDPFSTPSPTMTPSGSP